MSKPNIPEELRHEWIVARLLCPICTDNCIHVFHESNFRNDEENVFCECNVCSEYRMFDVIEVFDTTDNSTFN